MIGSRLEHGCGDSSCTGLIKNLQFVLIILCTGCSQCTKSAVLSSYSKQHRRCALHVPPCASCSSLVARKGLDRLFLVHLPARVMASGQAKRNRIETSGSSARLICLPACLPAGPAGPAGPDARRPPKPKVESTEAAAPPQGCLESAGRAVHSDQKKWPLTGASGCTQTLPHTVTETLSLTHCDLGTMTLTRCTISILYLPECNQDCCI